MIAAVQRMLAQVDAEFGEGAAAAEAIDCLKLMSVLAWAPVVLVIVIEAMRSVAP